MKKLIFGLCLLALNSQASTLICKDYDIDFGYPFYTVHVLDGWKAKVYDVHGKLFRDLEFFEGKYISRESNGTTLVFNFDNSSSRLLKASFFEQNEDGKITGYLSDNMICE